MPTSLPSQSTTTGCNGATAFRHREPRLAVDRALPYARSMEAPRTHELSLQDLLQWSRGETPVVRVHTATDALPGGLAAAMIPTLVNWHESPLAVGTDGTYLLHNVNISNNPIEGTTLLGSVRIAPDSLASAEFVVVLVKVGRFETDAGHAMLRFHFKEGQNPRILGIDGGSALDSAHLTDLVFSWEAWRPPRSSFDPLAGLDPSRYALTMRSYNGPTRCLGDVVLGRSWVCYPLKFLDIPEALPELLHVTLLLGDAVARQTIGSLLDEKIVEKQGTPGDYPKANAQEWRELRQAMKRGVVPEDPIQEILQGRYRYHTMLRSCVTMALTTIDWANVRIHDDAHQGAPKRIRVAPSSLPSFFDRWSHGSRSRALIRVPGALHWLLNHQTVIPARAYELLDEVDLLQREEGNVVRHHYDNEQTTAYSRIPDSLIY